MSLMWCVNSYGRLECANMLSNVATSTTTHLQLTRRAMGAADTLARGCVHFAHAGGVSHRLLLLTLHLTPHGGRTLQLTLILLSEF